MYIIMIIGFILLVKCADIFVEGSSELAKSLGIPSLIIGLTIVAFGTSAPEATVSIISTLEGKNDISIGNVIGSNICNLLFVLGVSSVIKPLKANKEIVKRDFPFSICTYILLLILVLFPLTIKSINRKEGLILIFLLIVYLYTLVKEANNNKKEKINFKPIYIFKIVFGIVGTILGGNAVVDSATKIAASFGVTEHFIGLSIIAIGTSLPELVTSVIATTKGENDLAIGNVVGSNIFNILFILGTTSTIRGLVITTNAQVDIILMLLFGSLVFYYVKKKTKINRKNGVVMIVLYICYLTYILYR